MSSRSAWSLVLAAALPVLVTASALGVLTRETPEALSPEAAAMEAQLAEERPDVLLVGNSLVGYGVNPGDLAAGLSRGGAPPRVSKLFSASLRPANWYVMLKNRLYAQDLHPELVVLVATPKMFFDVEPPSSVGKSMLAAHIGDYEPVLNAKLYGRTSAPSLRLHRLQLGRSGFQDWAHAAVRDASAGLFFGGYGSLLQRGHAVAEPAMQAVFGAEGAVDMSLHHRVIPVMQQAVNEDGSSERTARSASYEETLIPDLIELVQSNGGRLVLVWIPLSSGREDGGEVDNERLAALVGALNQASVGWLDLHEIELPPQSFSDSIHMSRKGRDVFTPALVEALVTVGAMDGEETEGGGMSRAQVPLVLSPEARWSGAPPSQDAPWLLAPGASVSIELGGWPGAAQGRVLELWLEPLAEGAAPVIHVDDRALEPVAAGRWLRLSWRDEGRGAPRLSIENPSGGAVALRRLTARAGDRQADVVGDEETTQPVRVDLTTPFARKLSEFVDPPFQVPLADLSPIPAAASVARSAMDGMLALGDAQVAERIPCRRCTPLTILEDGAPLPDHRARCGKYKLDGAGWYCMPAGRALLVSTEGENPATSGHSYTWALDEDGHFNEAGLWLYPGGEGAIRVRKESVARLSRDTCLRLEGLIFQRPAGDAAITVTVTVGEEERVRAEIPVSSLEAGVVEIPVVPSFTPKERPVIHLGLGKDAPFVLLTRLELGEPDALAGAETP